MLVDCGCLLAEFCAWQVKLAPSCSARAANLSMETELKQFATRVTQNETMIHITHTSYESMTYLSVETELKRLPSAISSCTAEAPSVMTELASSSQVICKQIRSVRLAQFYSEGRKEGRKEEGRSSMSPR